MKKNTSWKFTDESSVTFQSPVSGPGESGLSIWKVKIRILAVSMYLISDTPQHEHVYEVAL